MYRKQLEATIFPVVRKMSNEPNDIIKHTETCHRENGLLKHITSLF